MTRDIMICKRILMQVVQSGRFRTDDRAEAYHVALLRDRGYIEACVRCDEEGIPVSATVGRITAIGHDCYEKEFADESREHLGLNVSMEDYYNNLITTKRENEQARDKVLATIATGGIALCFSIVSYFHGHKILIHYGPCIASLVFWALTLIGLFISDHVGSRAIDVCIEHLNDVGCNITSRFTFFDRLALMLNLVNCLCAVLGIMAFAWFLLSSKAGV